MTNIASTTLLSLLLLIVATEQSQSQPVTPKQTKSVIHNDIVFGPLRHFSGTYFTNFERSTFSECDRAKGKCDAWEVTESEWVSCAPAACADLESRIKNLAGSHNISSLYAIDFLGRRSVDKTTKKFLGDTESKVYVERIEDFQLLKKN